MYGLEVYYIIMMEVYYMKCALAQAFCIIVMYVGGGLLHQNGGSILHDMGISKGV